MIPSAFYSFHLISFTRISRGQSHHKSGSLNNKYEYRSTSQSKARKSPANVRTPSVTSSEPLPKRPENPSRATAASVGRVHRGPRRDQLLDHGGVAFLSRVMQRRLASGAEDATRKAGCGCRRETKRIVMGCFSGWLGKKMWVGHIDRSASRCSWCEALGRNESNHRKSVMLYVCLIEILQAVAPYFRNIMCRMYTVSCQAQ